MPIIKNLPMGCEHRLRLGFDNTTNPESDGLVTKIYVRMFG